MKISLFKDWNICTWIDYSKKEDCIWVFDLSNTDIKKIENWCKLSSVWEIIETEEYLINIQEKQIATLKKECNEIILEKYPYYKQINMWSDIQEIYLVARQEKRAFNENEMWKVWEWKIMKDWIFEMRAECNYKISQL